MDCELCEHDGGKLLWRGTLCRVVRAASDDYPGFCRVVLNRHVREMTDLPAAERSQLMDAVFACESALRDLYRPDKINLASLGNQVPHLHWHVIARHAADAHFPDAVWAPRKREGRRPAHEVSDAQLSMRLGELLGETT